MKFESIVEKLKLSPVTEKTVDEYECVYCGDFLSRAMSRIDEGNLWVTIMNNINVIAVASLTDAAAVILCEDVRLMADAKEAAAEKDVAVFVTPLSAYEACCILGEIEKESK